MKMARVVAMSVKQVAETASLNQMHVLRWTLIDYTMQAPSCERMIQFVSIGFAT